MKKILLVILITLLCGAQAFAQVDRREVRAGNRAFKKEQWQKAEIDYKKALLKDSTSVAAQYNLANDLYREENYTEAEKYAKTALDSLSRSPRAADAYFNAGDIYLQQRRWSEAIEAFKDSLRRNPGDMDAKSNLAYAQKMLEKQQQDQQNQDQNDDQNQDQNNDQNKDQNQDQNRDNQDQNKDQNDDKQDNQDPNRDQQQNPDQNQDQQPPQQDKQDQKISPEAAEQMLQAIQAQEDQTQEKVKKEKAAALKSRQKEKNW